MGGLRASVSSFDLGDVAIATSRPLIFDYKFKMSF